MAKLDFTKSIIQKLPRTLQHLDIHYISWHDMYIDDFPPLLSFSTFSNSNEALNDRIVEILPRSLRSLSYAGIPPSTHILERLAKLFPLLDLISITTKFITSEENRFTSFASLPITLGFLCLKHLDPNVKQLKQAFLESRMNPHPWETLPPMIHTLTLDSNGSLISVSQLRYLPRSLAFLSFCVLVNDWEPDHPRNGKSLFLPPTKYNERDIFYSLPEGLQSIQIEETIPICDPLAFKSLPQNLDRFHWKTTQPHHPEVIGYLPRSLRYLMMHFDVITNGDIGKLPRNLQFCAVTADDSSTLDMNAVRLMPPNVVPFGINIGSRIGLARNLERKLPKKRPRY